MIRDQLPLPFDHDPSYATADFLEDPCNAEALAWLARPDTWPQRRLVVCGDAGSGKTHLLHMWARRRGAALRAGPMLSLGLEPPSGPLAIDDADRAPELPLLHVLNAANEAGHAVLMAARTPPSRWPVGLPDLASRLRATSVTELRTPDDAMLAALLRRLLAERQLPVPESIQSWLLLRLPRTPAAVREAAARLDRASLASGGRVTRAHAAQVLAELNGTSDAGTVTLNSFGTNETLTDDDQAASSDHPALL